MEMTPKALLEIPIIAAYKEDVSDLYETFLDNKGRKSYRTSITINVLSVTFVSPSTEEPDKTSYVRLGSFQFLVELVYADLVKMMKTAWKYDINDKGQKEPWQEE